MASVGITPNSHIYNSLLNAASLTGDSSKVTEVFSSMVKAGVKPDGVSYNILIKEAVKVHLLCANLTSKTQDIDEVAKLILQMAQNGVTPTQRTFVEAVQVRNWKVYFPHVKGGEFFGTASFTFRFNRRFENASWNNSIQCFHQFRWKASRFRACQGYLRLDGRKKSRTGCNYLYLVNRCKFIFSIIH